MSRLEILTKAIEFAAESERAAYFDKSVSADTFHEIAVAHDAVYFELKRELGE